MAMERGELGELVRQFTEAVNREDLDGVMSFMAEDAVYDEFNGTINRGTAVIRAAFEPQFRGDYGKLRDRKSTRLNSSHGYISYAVFCLKKKKTHHKHHPSHQRPPPTDRNHPSPTKATSRNHRPQPTNRASA